MRGEDFRRRRRGFALFGLLLAVALPQLASAEFFVEGYAGPSFAENDTLRCTGCNNLGLPVLTRSRTDYEYASSTFGLRGGYWFPGWAKFLGVGLDFSFYSASDDNIAKLDLLAVPVTPLLMLRLPLLTSDEFPNGQLQPYGAIGPGFTVTIANADFSRFEIFEDFVDAKLDVGFDARGGMAFQFHPNFAVFTEYRYTRVDLDFDDEVDFDFGPDIDVRLATRLAVHHAVAGVSFRF
ncbi:MAG: outer membrane beta-barrel protein [Myxococcota bacterium]